MTSQSTLMPQVALAPLKKSVQGIRQVADRAIKIERVNSRKAMKEFIDLPKRLYREDPHWVAPLDKQVKQFLDRDRHPFYRHGDAQALLAKRNGQTVGRILVSDDARYNQAHDSNVGCFGLLETVNDLRTCRHLLDAGSRWLLARGRTELLGPIDYSTNYPTGLLVDGFHTPPSVMMNHQPAYYEKLFVDCGLKKAKDLYAWWFDEQNQMDGVWREKVARLKHRYGVQVRPISFQDFDAEIARCKAIYNESFDENWGFVKMTEEEFDHLAREIKQLAVPELVQLAEVDGQPVGLSLAMPNINEAIQPLGGRLTTMGLPIGLIRLLHRMRKVTTGRLAVLGVLPGYRRRGVAEALIQQTFQVGFQQLGYQGAELGWTLEDNVLVNRMIERVGGQRYKTYRIFSKSLQKANSSSFVRSRKYFL